MTKVDPGLLHLVALDMRRAPGDESAPRPVHAAVRYTGKLDDLRRAGFTPLSRVRESPDGWRIVAGHLPPDRLDALSAVPHVVEIEGSRPMVPQLDLSVPAIHAQLLHAPPYNLRGTGVVIGIIDNGLHWQHPCFIRPNPAKPHGDTRILGIWDQSLAPWPGEAPPSRFPGSGGTPGLGVEYTREDIQDALDNGTQHLIRTSDTNSAGTHVSHGTHIAGIAAGNGSAVNFGVRPFTYVGVAPDADIIFVVFPEGSSAYNDHPHYINALDFIWDHPELRGRPVVLNMSWMERSGPHDGKTMFEAALTIDLDRQKGRAAVAAAGNDRTKRRRRRLRLAPGMSEQVAVEVPAQAADDIGLSMWYPHPGVVEVSVLGRRVPVGPIGPASASVVTGGTPVIQTIDPGKNFVHISSTPADLRGNVETLVVFDQASGSGVPFPAGVWEVLLKNVGPAEVVVDMWLVSNVAVDFEGVLDAEESGTVNMPGTCEAAITVGAYGHPGHHDPAQVDVLWSKSCFGPTRDGRNKPDLVAPGLAITSAQPPGKLFHDGTWSPINYGPLEGTSQAAAHVSGVVALMFQKNPRLGHPQIKRILTTTADGGNLPPGDQLDKANRWGAGRLDALAAVTAVPLPGNEDAFPVPVGPPAPQRTEVR